MEGIELIELTGIFHGSPNSGETKTPLLVNPMHVVCVLSDKEGETILKTAGEVFHIAQSVSEVYRLMAGRI